MRYYEIIESRRNPEQNPKESTLESLEKYAGRDDVFVSFTSDVGKRPMGTARGDKNTSGSKLGINPKSKYNTPIGIYTYPIDHVLSKRGKVEFAGKEPFLYVVQATKPLLDLNNYTEEDFERDSEKLIDMGFKGYLRDEGIDNATHNIPAGWLWNWTRLAGIYADVSGSTNPPVKWSKILRSLGYSGAKDDGSGIIHESEPTQAVFFSKDAVKVLEVIPNRLVSKPLKRTLSQIKNPSEETKLAAVRFDGNLINVIKNPSEAVKLAAVTKSGEAIRFIDDPSEKVQLAAVTTYGYAIAHIENPSKAVQLAAVNSLIDAILYIKNPSEESQLYAVTKDGHAIEYIIRKGITPSEKVQLAAVTQNGWAIEYIKNPSEAVQLAAVTGNTRVVSDVLGYIIRKGITPSEKVQLAAVTQDGNAIQHIKNPSEAVQLAAVNRNRWAILHIDNPSDLVRLAADNQFGRSDY